MYTGLDGLDRRLIERVDPKSGGLFVELGANDGFQQSNTLVLEKQFGWRGVLIEPVPELAAECARNRPGAIVVCAVASSPNATGSLVAISEDDLRGSVGEKGVLSVATTLSEILVATGLQQPVDLLSLDVEGHEVEVLEGLDFSLHKPRFLLIETQNLDRVCQLLGSRYGPPEQLSHHDYLFVEQLE